jgi:cytochrome b561
MKFFSPKQIARRAVLAPDALYHHTPSHGVSRSNTTRMLHLLLLLAVLHQLISSKVITRPLPGDTPSTLFMLHEYVGMATLAVVCTFWLWTLIRHGETSPGKLFPWLSPRRIAAIVHDGIDQFEAIRRGDFSGDSSGALASAVHGLGLLTVTAMAATGTVLFFSGGLVFHYAMSLHRVIANLMWAYLIGHAGLAALHHLLGSDILRRMFWISRGITLSPQPLSKANLRPDKSKFSAFGLLRKTSKR